MSQREHIQTEKYIAEKTCNNSWAYIEINRDNWLTDFLFFEESTVSDEPTFFTGNALVSNGTPVAAIAISNNTITMSNTQRKN